MRPVSCEGKCRHCGRAFYKTKAAQAYCSSSCQKARWAKRLKKEIVYVEKSCEFCAELFKVSHGMRLVTKYCSNPCKVKAGNNKRDKKYAEESKGKWATKISCKNCGKEFTPKKAAWARKHCSKRCRESFSSKRAKSRAKENNVQRTAFCKICGVEFIAKSSTHKFCSKTCLFKHSRKWNNSKKNRRYNKNNTGKYRKANCENCGGTKVLQVHHIDGSGRLPKPNNKEDNLQTLCTVCHLDIHNLGFRIIDGELYVTGSIFKQMGLTTVKVLKQ